MEAEVAVADTIRRPVAVAITRAAEAVVAAQVVVGVDIPAAVVADTPAVVGADTPEAAEVMAAIANKLGDVSL
jgi:hypothetical protein